MSDDENFSLLDKEDIRNALKQVTSTIIDIIYFSRFETLTCEDVQNAIKIGTKIYLKNIIDNKNKTGKFVPKSDFEAFVKEKVK